MLIAASQPVARSRPTPAFYRGRATRWMAVILLWQLAGIAPPAHGDQYRELAWADLLGAVSAPVTPARPLATDDATRSPEFSTAALRENARQQLAAEQSFAVQRDVNATRIAIAGFVVPLEDNPTHGITEFFLVPYAGACIHVPPPPPNQMIYVKFPKGIATVNIYDAYRVRGTLHTALAHSGLTEAAYTLDADDLGVATP